MVDKIENEFKVFKWYSVFRYNFFLLFCITSGSYSVACLRACVISWSVQLNLSWSSLLENEVVTVLKILVLPASPGGSFVYAFAIPSTTSNNLVSDLLLNGILSQTSSNNSHLSPFDISLYLSTSSPSDFFAFDFILRLVDALPSLKFFHGRPPQLELLPIVDVLSM